MRAILKSSRQRITYMLSKLSFFIIIIKFGYNILLKDIYIKNIDRSLESIGIIFDTTMF